MLTDTSVCEFEHRLQLGKRVSATTAAVSHCYYGVVQRSRPPYLLVTTSKVIYSEIKNKRNGAAAALVNVSYRLEAVTTR